VHCTLPRTGTGTSCPRSCPCRWRETVRVATRRRPRRRVRGRSGSAAWAAGQRRSSVTGGITLAHESLAQIFPAFRFCQCRPSCDVSCLYNGVFPKIFTVSEVATDLIQFRSVLTWHRLVNLALVTAGTAGGRSAEERGGRPPLPVMSFVVPSPQIQRVTNPSTQPTVPLPRSVHINGTDSLR
jgi:hypothetical protein